MRNSFYDALMVWCVPVMSEGDYARYCPYNDIIDYSAFVEIAIPKESGNVVTHLNETFDEEKAMSRLQRLHQVSYQMSQHCCPPRLNMRQISVLLRTDRN